jgi:large subunit ribosomal protein L17
MNHHKANRKFGRVTKVRNALMKSLARSLILEERIKTTDAKARELRPYAEKIITQGKTGTVAARRLLVAKIGPDGVKKLFSDISPKYMSRAGGYTRITKLPRRPGDGSLMAYIELV